MNWMRLPRWLQMLIVGPCTADRAERTEMKKLVGPHIGRASGYAASEADTTHKTLESEAIKKLLMQYVRNGRCRNRPK